MSTVASCDIAGANPNAALDICNKYQNSPAERLVHVHSGNDLSTLR